MRIERRKNECPDIFALRAFAAVLPEMDINAIRAFANYAWDRGLAEMAIRKRWPFPSTSDAAPQVEQGEK